MGERLSQARFFEIQSRIHGREYDDPDAWELLCEVRRLGSVIQNVMELTHLNEVIWGCDERLRHAQERLDLIQETCRRGRLSD